MKLASLSLFLSVSLSAMAQGPAYPYSSVINFNQSAGATGYNVYRAPFGSGSCGTFSLLNSTPFAAPPYSDSSPSQQGTYCYGATAVNANGESAMSNIASAVIIPPVPPTNLTVTAVQNQTNITVTGTWTQSTGTVTKNALYCDKVPTVPKTRRWTGAANTTGHFNVPLTTQGTFNCAVTASDGTATGEESGESVIAQVTLP